MRWAVLSRWVLSSLLRNPYYLLALAILAAAWPTLVRLAPLGITTRERTVGAPLYELAFVALLVGALFATALLGPSRWFLEPLPPRRRLAVEAWIHACCSAPLFAATLAFALGGSEPGPSTLRPLITSAALAWLHLLAIALVLERFELGQSTRLWALPVVVWLLPALLDGPAGSAGAVRPLLAVFSHLDGAHQSVSGVTEWKVALRPIIGLFALAFLIALPTKSHHALRHPG